MCLASHSYEVDETHSNSVGIRNYGKKFTYNASLVVPVLTMGQEAPDYHYFSISIITRLCSMFIPQFVSSAINLTLSKDKK